MTTSINNIPTIKDVQKIIVHPSFKTTISEIRKINVTITDLPKQESFDFTATLYPPNGKLSAIDRITKVPLSASNGIEISRNFDFTGYDESKLNYKTLEGMAVFTAHTLILSGKTDYLPVSYLTFYFYTRSQELQTNFPLLSITDNPEAKSNEDYVLDRTKFLNDWTFDGTICFIDGPLIGGNMTGYTIKLVENLHKKHIIPIFVVKNSDSNLVADNIPSLLLSSFFLETSFIKPFSSPITIQDILSSKSFLIHCWNQTG